MGRVGFLLVILLAAAIARGAEPPLADGSDETAPIFRRAVPVKEPQGDLSGEVIDFPGPKPQIGPAVPTENVALKACTGWLELLDQGRYSDSYQYVAPFVRDTFEEMRWVDLIIRQRKSLGAMKSREAVFVAHRTNMDGGPPGRYLVLHFFTEFDGGRRLEMVTLFQDSRDQWHICGYGLKDPAAAPDS